MEKTYYNSAYAILGVAIATLLFISGATMAFADNVSTDFESYSLGNINGQDGWSMTGPFDVEVDDSLGMTGFGDQSLRISNAVTSGSFGDQTFAKPLLDAAGEDVVETHFEAEFEISSTMLAEQEGLFMSVSPDDGTGSRMSYLSFKDTASGIEVTFYDVTNAGPLGTVSSFDATDLGTISRDEAHTIKFEIDFVDGPANDEVKIYIDGVLEHTGTTWEDYYRYDPEQSGNGNTVPEIDTLLFRVSGTAAPATEGEGFLVDNLSLESSIPVIEEDEDEDGILDEDDMCEGTTADDFSGFDGKQAKNRWMFDGENWVTNGKVGSQGGFMPTIEDTKGCSGEQILEQISGGKGHTKFGLTKGQLQNWING